MSISVEQIARLSSYVTSGSTMDRFVKANGIADEDLSEVQELWDDTKKTWDDLKPGEQLMTPTEWS